MDVLKLTKHKDVYIRLQLIHEKVKEVIETHHPTDFAIEAPFFGKNVQSMLKLGRAQGVAIAASLRRNIPYEEYTPKRIKQAITGNGNASKEQVAAMLQTLLRFDELPKYLDATDGLAAAVCHYFQSGKATDGTGSIKTKTTRKTGWKAFLSENPDRLG